MRLNWRFVLYNFARLLRFILYAYLILLSVSWVAGGDKSEAWRSLLLLLIPLIENVVKKYTPSILGISRNPTNLNRLISDLKLKEGVLEYVDLPVTRVDHSGKTISFQEIPERFPRVVVVGKAGTGKTTLLRYLVLQAAETCLKDKEQPFPILFDLSNWAGRKKLSGVLKEIEHIEQKPLSAIGQSNTYIFIDGLSASGPDSPKQLQQLKSWLQGPHAPVRVLISCRISEDAEPVDVGLPVVKLGDTLQEDHVREIVENYLHDLASDFLHRVLIEPQQQVQKYPEQVENPYAFAVARPFLLLALIRAYERAESHKLPKNPGALYDMLVKALWEQPKIRQMPGWIPFDQMTKILSYWVDARRIREATLRPMKWELSDELDVLTWGVQFAEIEHRSCFFKVVLLISSIFRTKIRRRHILPLFRVMVHANLLRFDSDQVALHNKWWFYYFRALQFRWNNIECMLPGFRHMEGDYSYYPMVIAASGLVADSDGFIHQIAQSDPYLAALCFINSDNLPSHQLRQEIIERTKDKLSSSDDPYFIKNYVRTLGLLCDVSIASEMIDVLDRVSGNYVEDTVVTTLASFGAEVVLALSNALLERENLSEISQRALIKALWKTESKQSIAVLKKLPESTEPRIKIGVAIALFRLGDQAARSDVLRLLAEHFKDKSVQYLLSDLGASAIDIVAEMLQKNEGERFYFLSDLLINTSIGIGEPAVIPLLDLLNASNVHDQIKRAVIESLGKVGDVRAVEPLIKVLQDADLDSPLRSSTIEALGRLREKRAVGLIIGCLEDKDAHVRIAAVEALGRIGVRETVPALTQRLKDQEVPTYHYSRVCDVAVRALASIDFPEANTALISWYAELLANPIAMDVYEHASGNRIVSALQMIGTKEAYDVLREKYPESYE